MINMQTTHFVMRCYTVYEEEKDAERKRGREKGGWHLSVSL